MRAPDPESLLADHRFQEYVRLFNDRRFFEAHEALEALWLVAPAEHKDLLQGLVQIAVALEHHARGNGKGARKVFERASRRLSARRRLAEVDIDRLLRLAKGFIEGRRSEVPRIETQVRSSGGEFPSKD